MSQFDVYPNPSGRHAAFPYLVELQADIASTSTSGRLVAPLIPANLLPLEAGALLPQVALDGVVYRVAVPWLRAVSADRLGVAAGNVGESRSDLLAALGRLFGGT